jgi:hypothetical protein
MCYGTASRTGRLNHSSMKALTPAQNDSDSLLSVPIHRLLYCSSSVRSMKLFRPRLTNDRPRLIRPVDRYASCDCLSPQYTRQPWQELTLHCEVQDTTSDAWTALEQYIAEVAASDTDELNPIEAIGPERWERIVTLPRSIQHLKSVRFLSLKVQGSQWPGSDID